MFSKENTKYKDTDSCTSTDIIKLSECHESTTNVVNRAPRGRSRGRRAAFYSKDINSDCSKHEDNDLTKTASEMDDGNTPIPRFKAFTSKFKGKF